MGAASIVTGIIGSLLNVIVGIVMIALAFLVEDLVDNVGFAEGFTDADEIVIAVLVIVGLVSLVAAILGIVGASLSTRKPTAGFVLLIIATSITTLFLLIALFAGQWQGYLPYLLAEALLVTSMVLNRLARREQGSSRY